MEKEQKHFSFSLVLIILIFLPSLPVSYSHHAPVSYLSFRDTATEKFTHITVHDTAGRVYIGAVNRIYQLTEDLSLEATAVMGPQDDSPFCPVTRVCPQQTKVPTDYYNKALLIHSSQNKLLACGSLFQGVCTVHDLDDVSRYNTVANVSVVANKDDASTVTFIAPGPDTIDHSQVLHVGVSYSGNGPYSIDVPAVSTRNLNPRNMLTLLSSELSGGTKLYVNSLHRDSYPITYVYGFSSDGFSYFVTIQKESESDSSPFISKLVRICQNDLYYHSYIEVPLSCKTSDGTDYNLAQAAYFEQSGHDHAKELGIPEKGELFIVFAKSEDTEDSKNNNPSQNSALCKYSMSDVRSMFTQNIQHCYDGNGKTNLEFVVPSISCFPVHIKVENDFCGFDVNTPLGGTIPIEAAAVLSFPGILLTAVTATSTNGHTVIFLGTSSGHLKKADLHTNDEASEYSDIVIEEGSPVNADLVFDKTKDHIYVMTRNLVTKVDVRKCERFHTCSDCSGGGDPYCGWCSLKNKCLTRKDCVETGHDSVCWFSRQANTCSASIEPSAPGKDTAQTAEQGATPPGRARSPAMEETKLATLQDIAQSMRNIDMSLKLLIELQREKN